MKRDPVDAALYPTLSDDGRRLLAMMREHPAAPIFRNQSGNKLLAHEVDALRQFERTVMAVDVPATPVWRDAFVADVLATVPYYRRHQPGRFEDIPTVSRADLARDIAAFVPDHVDIARMICFHTSGTTGHPLIVPSHPLVAGRYLAYHKRALARVGITLTHGRGQVGVVLLGHQQRCFTYVSVTPTMDESGLVKLNLHPNDWKDPADRARYLDALAPEIVAGDPVSFAEYLTLPVTRPPRALLSVSMMLTPGLRARLEQRFGCPVLDIYSLNEVGPVAVFDAAAGGHVQLQERLHIEILDSAGQPVALGESGEITVTGGFNFCLPLLRYRTGDHASLAPGATTPTLVGLAGRQPLRFLARGAWLNNVDITHALKDVALAQFRLHQHADGVVTVQLAAVDHAEERAAVAALAALFGAGMVRQAPLAPGDKFIQYTSELPGAQA